MRIASLMHTAAPLWIAITFALGVLLVGCIAPEESKFPEGWRVDGSWAFPPREEQAELNGFVERHGGVMRNLDSDVPSFAIFGLPAEPVCQEMREFALGLESMRSMGDCYWWD